MLQSPKFWKAEAEAPLMTKNRGFLSADNTSQILERTAKWNSLIKKTQEQDLSSIPTLDQLKDVEKPQRIFVKDAERTFFDDEHRKNLIKVHTLVNSKFGDYHQGLGYVTSFLLLTHDVPTTVSILSEVNQNEFYLPGYWKAEAVGFAIDAYVFDHLLEKFHPDVRKLLQDKFILPETYLQKWFIGLGIHVLPFDALFLFFEMFLQHGYTFLFQFGLSFFEHTKDAILKAKQQADIYAILRLENKKEEDLALQIVEKALKYDLSEFNFKELRTKMYEEKLKARLEAAKKSGFVNQQESDDEEDSEEDEDEEGQECQICTEMIPDFYCTQCKVLVCEQCHEEGKGEHKKNHKVKPIDEVDVDALTEMSKKLSLKDEK